MVQLLRFKLILQNLNMKYQKRTMSYQGLDKFKLTQIGLGHSDSDVTTPMNSSLNANKKKPIISYGDMRRSSSVDDATLQDTSSLINCDDYK